MKNDYELVNFENNNYYVIKHLKKNGENKLFVIDAEDFDTINTTGHSYYDIKSKIGYREYINDVHTTVFLHDIVTHNTINKLPVEYINGITYDLRKCNLRMVNFIDEKNIQTRKISFDDLPENCGIKKDQIPKCVYYQKKQGLAGDSFVLKIRIGNKYKYWYSTSSKDISTYDKFAEIIEIILKLNKEHPEYFEEKEILQNYSEDELYLMMEFNTILMASTFDCIIDNLVIIPKIKTIKSLATKTSKKMKKYLETIDPTKEKTGRNHISTLPFSCGITMDMIPKHCYYKPPNGTNGDSFRIDKNHPLLSEKKEKSTTTSKKVSTHNKFQQLLEMIKDLESKKK
ncbi:hypothetical protein qu_445 [Acanthamoeba polyphaga mimivirus]|nr:hypothetical protein [Mimivirus reunion]WMV61780.1 hypothetical protein qu_445 [Mimivirus sp.]WMV62757.1 hypothetical protein qu_445 [Acanthamoeba polyphaga mimivirus]WMV63734.1 hypothetical protein qu_445 [Mimivirus sp.]